MFDEPEAKNKEIDFQPSSLSGNRTQLSRARMKCKWQARVLTDILTENLKSPYVLHINAILFPTCIERLKVCLLFSSCNRRQWDASSRLKLLNSFYREMNHWNAQLIKCQNRSMSFQLLSMLIAQKNHPEGYTCRHPIFFHLVTEQAMIVNLVYP